MKPWALMADFASADALLADPAITLVYNCLPPSQHARWSIAAKVAAASSRRGARASRAAASGPSGTAARSMPLTSRWIAIV